MPSYANSNMQKTYNLKEVARELGISYQQVYDKARKLRLGYTYKAQYRMTRYNIEILKRHMAKREQLTGVYGGMKHGKLKTFEERKRKAHESTKHN